MTCPQCKTILKETQVESWDSGGNIRVIGKQKFCLKEGCDYEGEIKKVSGNNGR